MIAPGDRPSGSNSESDEPFARVAPVSMNADAAEPTLADDIQQALDTPLVDPYSEPEHCDVEHPIACVPGIEHFKALARRDYELAETLWAGLFCSLSLSLGIQLVGVYIRAVS